jgi:hypothetical protein
LIEAADRDAYVFGDLGGGEFAIAHTQQNLMLASKSADTVACERA